MATEETKALVHQVYEASNQGLDAFLAAHRELFDPNEVSHFGGLPPLNYEAHEQFSHMLYAAFPAIQYVVEDVIVDGDKAVARWMASGRQTGAFQGVPPSGKHVSAGGIDIFRVAGGKIVEVWSQFDMLGLLQQIGAFPAPREEAVARPS